MGDKGKNLIKALCFEVRGSPLLVLFLEIALDPGDGDGSPHTSPGERQDPADLCSVSQEDMYRGRIVHTT
jgi:hypothetical protein